MTFQWLRLGKTLFAGMIPTVFGSRHGDASSLSAHAKPVASVLRKRFGLVAAFALTHEWNFLVRIPLKLRSSFPGEQDVQTISVAVHPRYYLSIESIR
jgi:hypothetical protein